MRAGTQKVRNTENGARVHSPLCYLLTVKKTEMTGGELSRQWNTQPARPTTGSPQAHPRVPTRTSGASGNHRTYEKAPHTRKRRAPEPNPGTRHHSLSMKQLSRKQLRFSY